MITPKTLADYIKQYKELNPGVSEFDLCNFMFNNGYFIGRKRKKIEKWDISPHDWRYKTNPYVDKDYSKYKKKEK